MIGILSIEARNGKSPLYLIGNVKNIEESSIHIYTIHKKWRIFQCHVGLSKGARNHLCNYVISSSAAR